MSLQRGINLRALAEKMGQCSGAEVRGICTEAGTSLPFVKSCLSRADGSVSLLLGMYALRERRQHVTQEDFEFAVAKVRGKRSKGCVVIALTLCLSCPGSEEEPRREHVCEQTVLVVTLLYFAFPIYAAAPLRLRTRPKWQESGRESPEVAGDKFGVGGISRSSFISFLSSTCMIAIWTHIATRTPSLRLFNQPTMRRPQ
jgi:hypothetical protein